MPARKYEVQDNSAAVEAIMERIDTRGFTPLQKHFGEWVAEKSGVEFGTAKEQAAFIKGASTALALRMEHQKSPENHEFKAEQREAREQEAAARPKRAPKAVVEEEDEAPAPKRRGRPAKVVDEAPAAPVRRGRRAAAASAPASETSAPVKPGRRPAAAGRARRGANKAEADF